MEQNHHYILVVKPKNKNIQATWTHGCCGEEHCWRALRVQRIPVLGERGILPNAFSGDSERGGEQPHGSVPLATTVSGPLSCQVGFWIISIAVVWQLACPVSQVRSSWGFWLKIFGSAGRVPAQWFEMDAIKGCWPALKTAVSKAGVPIPGGSSGPPQGLREKIPEPLAIIFYILFFENVYVVSFL